MGLLTPYRQIYPNTITIWGPFDSEDIFAPVVKNFASQHKGYKAQYKKIDISEFDSESLLSLAAQTGPDIWLIPNDWLGRHLDKFVPAPEGLFK